MPTEPGAERGVELPAQQLLRRDAQADVELAVVGLVEDGAGQAAAGQELAQLRALAAVPTSTWIVMVIVMPPPLG